MTRLHDAIFSNGYITFHYTVDKDITEDKNHIIVKDQNKDCKIITDLDYSSIPEYEHPMLSWYNLLFCSNNYEPTTDHDYMNLAVQSGQKTAATIYLNYNSPEGQKLIESMPSNCEAMPYGDTMIYMYHKGKLSDFFDYEQIRDYYQKYGCYGIDWNIVYDYFQKDLSFFGNESECGFSLQSGQTNEQSIITGLVLGYPVASTARWIKW